MLTHTPAWAQPGCYGQALTFSEGHMECRSCPFAQGCKVDHLAAIERLRSQHGIVFKGKGPAIAPKEKRDLGASGFAVPKKVDDLLLSFSKAGLRVGESLAKGINPFPKGFMKITAHLLLHAPMGVSRENLIEGFMQRLNWSKGTAAPHATQAIQALVALGVAEERNSRLHLKR